MTDQSGPAIDQTFTLNEAARMTGLSVDALRQRAKRGRLETVKGNDGLVRVRLSTADLDALRLVATSHVEPTTDSQPDQRDQTVRALEADATRLREALSRERVRADQAELGEATARTVAERQGEELTR